MKINELAKLAHVTKRTLHYYDEIGLLTPSSIDNNGYRIYSDQKIDELQQILFFRELNMSLKQIKQIMQDPTFDAIHALQVHKQILLQKQEKLDELIRTIDKTVLSMKGGEPIMNEEKFNGFDFSHPTYEEEAKEKYGKEAVNQVNKALSADMQEEMNALFADLAQYREIDASEDKAQEKIAEWFVFLNKIGNYSYDAFAGLGAMYLVDERFTKNIDQFGEGLATWMAEAMQVYAEKQKNQK